MFVTAIAGNRILIGSLCVIIKSWKRIFPVRKTIRFTPNPQPDFGWTSAGAGLGGGCAPDAGITDAGINAVRFNPPSCKRSTDTCGESMTTSRN